MEQHAGDFLPVLTLVGVVQVVDLPEQDDDEGVDQKEKCGLQENKRQNHPFFQQIQRRLKVDYFVANRTVKTCFIKMGMTELTW